MKDEEIDVATKKEAKGSWYGAFTAGLPFLPIEMINGVGELN